jgi:hypothetical protein
LEINTTDFVYEIVDFTHVFFEAGFDLWSCVHWEIVEIVVGHSNQSIFWPWKEPIDCALREERWELLRSLSEFVTDGREGKNGVEAILNSVDEEGKSSLGPGS